MRRLTETEIERYDVLDEERATKVRIQRLPVLFWASGMTIGRFVFLRRDDDHFDMNVTRCAYAELMERLGARDIGPLLICNADFAMAERAGLELERTQTRMQGAAHCDFRYRRRR